jgi:hypothetical protein
MAGDMPSAHVNRVRQCGLVRFEAFVLTTQEFDSQPALGETFVRLVTDLRARWPAEAQVLPVCPAFRA